MTSEAIKWNFSSYTDNKGRPISSLTTTGGILLRSSLVWLSVFMLVSMFSMNVMP